MGSWAVMFNQDSPQRHINRRCVWVVPFRDKLLGEIVNASLVEISNTWLDVWWRSLSRVHFLCFFLSSVPQTTSPSETRWPDSAKFGSVFVLRVIIVITTIIIIFIYKQHQQQKNEKIKCINVLHIFVPHYIHCQFVGSNPLLNICRCINIHLPLALWMGGGVN